MIRRAVCIALALLASVPPALAEDGVAGRIAEARAALAPDCSPAAAADRLDEILCAGRIRIGVRADYAGFGEVLSGEPSGFEIGIAREIGRTLGLEVDLVTVTPITRISSLGSGSTDLVIATMGHNTARDGEARFIRPHYYASETVLVAPREMRIADWTDLRDRTVCTTVGNYANVQLAPRVSRLMLFDKPARLVAALESGICRIIANDDSVLVPLLSDPRLGERFETKLSFAEVPWGMAVAQEGTDRLAALLEELSLRMHADGTYLRLAEGGGIATDYLESASALWRTAPCVADPAACFAPPLETRLPPSSVAGLATSIEDAVTAVTGRTITLSMMHTAVAWDLFVEGVMTSLFAVVAALVATVFFALVFANGLTTRSRVVAWPLQGLIVVLQSAPNILVLAIVAAFANVLLTYSVGVALGVAVFAVGIMNGAFAGQAIADAWRTLDRDGLSRRAGLVRAIGLASPQLEAFLANATRSISAASFVGVADLTNALNDITSFSSSQATTYWVLLLFYLAVVLIVLRVARILRLRLERLGATA